jgi:hypothetical protein
MLLLMLMMWMMVVGLGDLYQWATAEPGLRPLAPLKMGRCGEGVVKVGIERALHFAANHHSMPKDITRVMF